MQQRISVRAIIRHQNTVLLLQRAGGPPAEAGKYELPGGRLESHEQPEDALRRHLQATTGLSVQALELYDAVTHTVHTARDIQYVEIIYTVSAGASTIRLNERYSHYLWQSLNEIQQYTVTEVTLLLLNIIQQQALTLENVHAFQPKDDKNTTKFDAIIYSDGGSRGNPGPSAAGFVILSPAQEVIEQGGEYLGITTNSVAEYQAVRLGLERAHDQGVRRIDFRLDSMLVVNQMNGLFTIKNRELWPIHERIRQLMKQFEYVRYSHVKREFNQLADGMVNKTLDRHKRILQENDILK